MRASSKLQLKVDRVAWNMCSADESLVESIIHDLTFTKMAGNLNKCPTGTARFCDSANPFNREAGTRNIVNMTVDKGEVYYFLVEGGDDAEGAFSISLECGT